MQVECTCGITRAVAVVYTYVWACVSSVTLFASRYKLSIIIRLDSALSSKLIITREMQNINGASSRVLDSLFERIAFKTF